MTSFSEQYREYKQWSTKDRTPEDYDQAMKKDRLWDAFFDLADSVSIDPDDKWNELVSVLEEPIFN